MGAVTWWEIGASALRRWYWCLGAGEREYVEWRPHSGAGFSVNRGATTYELGGVPPERLVTH